MSKEGQIFNFQETEREKYLSVHIDTLLNFKAHCENQVNKGNKITGLI
ncbi:hypothetical protein LSH36_2589g00000 [Paralvinella palmiformis]|uniref:Uncharacterized protein n=1 Tax=Paralvinella palmiformis TaxID=53620 RepID=A0AAD9IQJ5_9ANNE|nr:hypothetical protein LSH36_2589g00000 [Paralvinella palmiformis]